LTNEQGIVTDRYTYGVYGELEQHEGITSQPFQYNGRDGVMTDPDGLFYLRARYYLFQNTTKVLPEAPGRVWSEADIGLSNTMSRSKQPGTRLLYSNDGQMYITTDHYETVNFIGTYK